jgi:hypothetical protein
MFDLQASLLPLLPSHDSDCQNCDAGYYRNLHGLRMPQPLGSSTPDIAYIVDPPRWPEDETGHACNYNEQKFISEIHELTQVDIIAAGYAPLEFCILPIIGCPATALLKACVGITEVRCFDRIQLLIATYQPRLVIALSKELSLLSHADLSISGMYAISKLNSVDAERRILADALKIRQLICTRWQITLTEAERPTTLRQF